MSIPNINFHHYYKSQIFNSIHLQTCEKLSSCVHLPSVTLKTWKPSRKFCSPVHVLSHHSAVYSYIRLRIIGKNKSDSYYIYFLLCPLYYIAFTSKNIAYILKYTGQPILKLLTFKDITLMHSYRDTNCKKLRTSFAYCGTYGTCHLTLLGQL